MTPPPTVWNGVLRRLRESLPEFALDAWVRPLVAQPHGSSLELLCPSLLHKQRISERYLQLICECASAEAGTPIRVEVSVDASAARMAQAIPPATEPTAPAVLSAVPAPAPEAPAPPPPGLRVVTMTPDTLPAGEQRLEGARPQQYCFDNFVQGPCNAFARAASWAVAAAQQPALRQLYLAGSPGLGKTHLARAVATEAARDGRARVLYTSAERFTNEFLGALRARKTASFKRRFREQCDLLVIEDVQFLRGKASTQLELFYTVDHLLDVGARVVVTADRMPRDVPDLDERLRSTLVSGVVAELEPPDAEVRRRILRERAAAAGVRLPAACLERMVDALRGSVRDLEAALTQVVVSASLLGQPIDSALVESALRKLAPEPPAPARLAPDEVIERVAGFFGTTPAQLRSRSRRRELMVPRQLAMYLCRRYTDASLSTIGRAFGRNHPSVKNAIAVVERAVLERPRLRYQLEAASAHLESQL